MKKKFLGTWVLLPILVLMIAAGGCGGGGGSGGEGESESESATTFTAGTYKDLYDILKSVNPDGNRYAETKDDTVIIELTADLEAEAVGAESDYVTGATLTISRSNITIDGKDNKIESHRLPSFFVHGNNKTNPLKNVVIKNLTVNEGAIAKPISGGALYFTGYADVEMTNCTFTNCSSVRQGGSVLYTYGWEEGSMSVKIENCAFSGNSALGGTGGALLGLSSKFEISNSRFDNNTAALGGAILMFGDGANLTVDSASSFTNNTAQVSGGAIHIGYGGYAGVSSSNISAVIDNPQFSGNKAAFPGTGDYIFSVSYTPDFVGELYGKNNFPDARKPLVNGVRLEPLFFFDNNRTTPFAGQIIPAGTYEALQKALGYCKYANGDFEKDEGGHGLVTEGTANDGDIVYLTENLLSKSTNPDATAADDITGATIYVTKNVKIFGNGHTIDGNGGFPVFSVEGGNNEDPEVNVSISDLTIKNGGYKRKLGGAIFVEGNVKLSVYSSTFEDCLADGGAADAITGGGGAIYLEPHGKGTPKLRAQLSKFNRNKAPKGTGGAISAINGEVEIYDCEFTGNEAAEGGAVGLKGKGKFVLHDGDFSGNKAVYSGGAVTIHHGRSFYKRTEDLNQDSVVTTTFLGESEFSGNTAGLGGNDFSYARFYDDKFPDDSSKPLINYQEAHGETMSPIHTDLTFHDIYRMTKD